MAEVSAERAGTGVVVERVRVVDDALVADLNRLLPQLNNGARQVSVADLRQVLAAPGTVVLIALVGGVVVGTTTVVTYPIPSGTHAWLEDVVVDEDARGIGAGEALVRAALAEAEALGAGSVDLTSGTSREAAIRLYERLGFRRRDTSVFRYQEPLFRE